MANEFNLSASLNFQPVGNPTANIAVGPVVLSVATLGSARGKITATTGGVDITLDGITNPGYVVMWNQDTTNTVDIYGNGSSVPLASLRPAKTTTGPPQPQGYAIFELAPTVLSPLTFSAPTCKTRAGTADVQFVVYPSS